MNGPMADFKAGGERRKHERRGEDRGIGWRKDLAPEGPMDDGQRCGSDRRAPSRLAHGRDPNGSSK